jgi:hypothetical protein
MEVEVVVLLELQTLELQVLVRSSRVYVMPLQLLHMSSGSRCWSVKLGFSRD